MNQTPRQGPYLEGVDARVPAIALDKVSRAYQTPEMTTLAVAGASLSVRQGEFLAITGPSGCGKSTLLSLMGLVECPDEGSVSVMGTSTVGMGPWARRRLRARHLAFVFQSFNLVGELDARGNVALPLLYRGLGREEAFARAEACLQQVGLAHRAGHFPAQLSGGQQQRVAIARAIAADCSVLLADEPTGNLDPDNRETVLQLITDLNANGATVVIVTHDEALAERAHRRLLLDGGRIMQDSTSPTLEAVA